MQYNREIINESLHYTREAITEKIRAYIDEKQNSSGAYESLYDLIKDYPFRIGKMLRPAICISVVRSVGGLGHSGLTIAAALELYHNAFLIKDDCEDESESRRGKETLYRQIGHSRAINVGDATNVLAVGLILENLSILGVGKTLHILHEIENMALQSVEGQAMELDWRYANVTSLTDTDYIKMCVKKTCWYTFMTPCRIGLIAGSFSKVTPSFNDHLNRLSEMAMHLGLAFQIQDDRLNLEGDLENYGKEIGGDIYEGKRTIMLNHVLRESKRKKAILKILGKPRAEKKSEDVAFVLAEMQSSGSLEYAKQLSEKHALKAIEILDTCDFLLSETPLRAEEKWKSAVTDARFIREVIKFVIARNH